MIWLVALLLAAPKFASKPDSSDDKGHTFVCEGEGATEEDAFAAAQGVCSDKICKVCGVEVESVVETRETLTGIDLQRKVVERCRRVRRSETKLRSKASECESGACSAWIEVFYSKEDQAAECQSYTKEDFTDPAACEKDVQAFRDVQGVKAEAFREREQHLKAALRDCEKIDVRPTPALMALDEKLRKGLAQFEAGEGERWQSYYLKRDEELHQQIAESKLLIERLKLAHDYVANKALVMDVIEAAQARDLDSPAGVERLRKAMLAAPAGRQYGASNVHFGAIAAIWRFKSDTSPIGAALRQLYPPDKAEDPFGAAKLFADDGKVTAEEWQWTLAAHRAHSCLECLRTLLQADPDVTRAREALPTVLTGDARRDKGRWAQFVGYNNPQLALDLEPQAPVPYDFRYMKEVLDRIDRAKPDVKARFVKRAVEVLAREPTDYNACTSLAAYEEQLQKLGGDVSPLDAHTCSCLQVALKGQTSLVNRDDLAQIASRRRLACARE